MLGLGSVCEATRAIGAAKRRAERVERSRQTPGIRCQLCPHLQVNSRLWCVLNITATGAFMNRVPATGAIPRLCPCKIFASWFKHVPNWPEMKKKHEKKKVSGPLFLRLVSLRILRKINFWIWWNVSKMDRNFLFSGSHGYKTSSKPVSKLVTQKKPSGGNDSVYIYVHADCKRFRSQISKNFSWRWARFSKLTSYPPNFQNRHFWSIC